MFIKNHKSMSLKNLTVLNWEKSSNNFKKIVNQETKKYITPCLMLIISNDYCYKVNFSKINRNILWDSLYFSIDFKINTIKVQI